MLQGENLKEQVGNGRQHTRGEPMKALGQRAQLDGNFTPDLEDKRISSAPIPRGELEPNLQH